MLIPTKQCYVGVLMFVFATTAFAAGSDTRAEKNVSWYQRFGVYVGSGVGIIKGESNDAFDKDIQFKAGEVFAGAYWRWIGFEFRTGQSFQDESFTESRDPDTGFPRTADASLTDYNSVYLRLQLQNDIARIYALTGTSNANTTATFRDGSKSEKSGTGDAFGVGLGLQINDNLSFNLETKYLLKSDSDNFFMSGFTLEFRL